MKNTLLNLSEADLVQIKHKLAHLIDVPKQEAEINAAALEVYRSDYDWSANHQLEQEVLFSLGEYYGRNNLIPQAQEIFEHLISILETNGQDNSLRRAKANLAITHAQCGYYHQAIDVWRNMLEDDIPPQMRITLMNNLSVGYGITGQYEMATEFCFKSLTLADELRDDDAKVDPLINLGAQYYAQELVEKALQAWLEADLLAQKTGRVRRMIENYNSICLAYGKLNDRENALLYGHKALSKVIEYSTDDELARVYNNLGVIHRSFGEQEEAASFFSKACELYEKSFDSVSMANTLMNVAELYINSGKHAQAGEYLARAEALIVEHDIILIKERFLGMMTLHHREAGRLGQAFEYSQQLIDFLQETNRQNSQNTISQEEARYYRGRIEKQNELLKKQNQELSEANKSLLDTNELLNRVISIVSHDVRAPLANIIQALDLINEGLIDIETQRQIFQDLENSSAGIFDLLNDVLNWLNAAKPSQNKELNKTELNLAKLTDDILALYQPIAKSKGLELLNLSRGKELIISSEADLLRVLIRNLVNNAIKFTHLGGKVVVELTKDQDVWIKVSDTGVGMTEEQIQNIMQGNTDIKLGTAKEQGYGLGFRLCLDSVRRLGGKLEIESKPEQGTSVRVTLPC